MVSTSSFLLLHHLSSGSPAKDHLVVHPATPYNSIRKRIKSVSIKYLKHRQKKKEERRLGDEPETNTSFEFFETREVGRAATPPSGPLVREDKGVEGGKGGDGREGGGLRGEEMRPGSSSTVKSRVPLEPTVRIEYTTRYGRHCPFQTPKKQSFSLVYLLFRKLIFNNAHTKVCWFKWNVLPNLSFLFTLQRAS